MPQIDTPLLLDILLGLVVLLLVPFGIRRGAAKEAMVSAGVLFGAALADRFGSSWGRELADRFALGTDAATFASSALLLFGSAFFLGYGGGAALGATRPGVLSRLAGGLLAAFNGALILTYLLSWIEVYLRPTAPLDSGIVSEALLRQTDLLMLSAAGILLALTIFGWVVNMRRSRLQPHRNGGGSPQSTAARQHSPRALQAIDSGKYEPGGQLDRPSGRFDAALDATTSLSSSRPSSQSEIWSDNQVMGGHSNGHGSSAYSDSSSRSAAGPSSASADETVWTPWTAPGSNEPRAPSGAASEWPVAPSVGVTGDERCAVCRARVGPRDVFCPDCGATL